MSSHPIRKAQPKIRPVLQLMPYQHWVKQDYFMGLVSYIPVCMSQVGNFKFIFFKTAFPAHVHTCDPLQPARLFSEEVFPSYLLMWTDDLVMLTFFANSCVTLAVSKGQTNYPWSKPWCRGIGELQHVTSVCPGRGFFCLFLFGLFCCCSLFQLFCCCCLF